MRQQNHQRCELPNSKFLRCDYGTDNAWFPSVRNDSVAQGNATQRTATPPALALYPLLSRHFYRTENACGSVHYVTEPYVMMKPTPRCS